MLIALKYWNNQFLCRTVYNQLTSKGMVTPVPEKPPPTIPMDYNWARELKLIRKPANFMSTISDERGQELLYAGMPISDVFKVHPTIYLNTVLYSLC